ncbi:hypothetical protein MD484_g8361, partial [Candolleomyces efflorescens]
MAPSTPKRTRAAPETALPTPPKTPVRGRTSVRAKATHDSRASRTLQRLRDKLRQRAASGASVTSRPSGELLPALEITSAASTTRPSKKRKTADEDKVSVPLVEGEIIEISSDDNHGESNPNDNDKPFRGRGSRTRVRSSSSATVPPPLRTRGFFKRTGTSFDHQEPGEREGTPVLSDTDEELALNPYDALTRRAGRSSDEDSSPADSENEYDSQDSFIDDSAMEVDKSGSKDERASTEYPSDEEFQIQLAMIRSVVTAMAPDLTKDRYDQAVHDAATKLFNFNGQEAKKKKGKNNNGKKRRSKGKGKGKAPVHEPQLDDLEGLFSDDDGPAGDSEPIGTASTSPQHTVSGASLFNSTVAASSLPGPSASSDVPVTLGSLISAPVNVPTLATASSNPVQPNAPAVAGQQVTMASLVATVPGAATQETGVKYVRRVLTLPESNGVHLPDLQEPILAGDYPDLCNLRAGHFIAWTNTRGRPRTALSAFGRTMPNMSATLALDIIRFQHVGQYINPSRISPLEVELKEYPTDPPRYHVVRNRRPAYCVMLGAVSRSQLMSRSNAGLRQRYINVRGVPVEFERQEGWTCMVAGHERLAAQYALNALQASTKSDFTKGEGKTTPIYTDEWTIDSDDQVPIYDARQAGGFTFAADVADIHTRLPRWPSENGEIPRDSCVAVAYTMSFFFSNTSQQWTVGCNIRWVMVLGVPTST